ncbi:MAG: hypothetical protein EA427_09940 [Spirochaetaceae bacterium]|nr:MAG: hypothetical protein EA427_09940 [Spirochaetaceae bacterium]
MREIMGHTPGKIYLFILLVSIVALAAAAFTGVMDTPEGAAPTLVLGWMTMPLVLGFAFVAVWLVAYLVYFFFFWPYR